MTADGGEANEMEVVEPFGIKVPLDPAFMSEKMQVVLRSGRYDMGRARLADRTLEEGERVLDLGAGLGFISALLAKDGRAEMVVAVEGDPRVIPLIQTVHHLNGVDCVVLNRVVVAKKAAETVKFFVHHDLWASSALPLKRRDRREVIQVPAVTFEELIAKYSPTLLMLDFEVFRELVPSYRSPDTDVFGDIDFTPVRKVQLMFKPKLVGPRGIRRAFQVLTAQGFAYDPACSAGDTVLMRRIDD